VKTLLDHVNGTTAAPPAERKSAPPSPARLFPAATGRLKGGERPRVLRWRGLGPARLAASLSDFLSYPLPLGNARGRAFQTAAACRFLFRQRRRVNGLLFTPSMGGQWPVALFAKAVGLPVLMDAGPRPPAGAKILLRLADRVLCASRPARAELRRRRGLPASRVDMLPPAVNTALWRPASPDEKFRLRKKLGFDPRRRIVVVAGAAPEAFWAAWPDLSKRHRAWLLFVEALGVAPAGMDWLRAADVFFLPSRTEEFPPGLLEAMAAGLPVVAPAMDGLPPDPIAPASTGLLFRNGEELRWALDLVLGDETFARLMGERGREKAGRLYNAEDVRRRTARVYGGTLKTPRPAALWLTWENHRRSRELAGALGAKLQVVRKSRWASLNPLWPLMKTIGTLLRASSPVVVVQNPSLLLATVACLLKPLKGYRLVQDLHSYFCLHMERPRGLKGRVYRPLSRFCARRADLTIVTNAPLADFLRRRWGARAMVLQDKLPHLDSGPSAALRGHKNVVFISTYSDDEPLGAVLDAARRLPSDVHLYITGRPPKKIPWDVPSNVTLTGFLSEADYAALLSSSDAVMALTTRDHTLLCGAYEAVAARRPLVLSDKDALRGYFHAGAVYVENNADGLAAGTREALGRGAALGAETDALASVLTADWNARFNVLRRRLRRWGGDNGDAPAPA